MAESAQGLERWGKDLLTYAIAVAAILTFTVAFWASGAVRAGVEAMAAARRTIAALRDENLSDDDHARAARRGSIALFGAFASIAVRCSGVLALSFGVIWCGDRLGLAATDDVLEFLLRWEVLVATFVLFPLGHSVPTFLMNRA